jgi:hypothetical protein
MAGFVPDLTYLELREAILESVDPVPALEGKTITGGRLNVYAAVERALGFPPTLAVRLHTSVPAPSVLSEWSSLTGKVYSLFRRPALDDTGTWVPVTGFTNIEGTGSTMSFTDTVNPAGQGFYRVGAETP